MIGDKEMTCYICGRSLNPVNWFVAGVSDRYAPLLSENLCHECAFPVADKFEKILDEMREGNNADEE